MTKNAAKKPAAPRPKSGRKASARSGSGQRRIDGAGHMNPEHAARLRELGSETRDRNPTAFVEEPNSLDELAEALGEDAVAAMTAGQGEFPDKMDEPQEEERGGPFIETTANTELGGGADYTSEEEATHEPATKT